MSAIHLSLAELATRIRTKEISPTELLELHLQRIAEVQPRLNAFVHVDENGARERAAALEATTRTAAECGALLGIPVTVKSCSDVGGFGCGASSWRGR